MERTKTRIEQKPTQKTMTNTQSYIPGVCNIDAKGRTMRARFGAAAIALTIAGWVLLNFARSISPYWTLLLTVPALAGFIGIWQAKYSFCVVDAAKHQYEHDGTIGKITNTYHIAKDNQKARMIYAYSLISAILFTALLIGITFLLKKLSA